METSSPGPSRPSSRPTTPNIGALQTDTNDLEVLKLYKKYIRPFEEQYDDWSDERWEAAANEFVEECEDDYLDYNGFLSRKLGFASLDDIKVDYIKGPPEWARPGYLSQEVGKAFELEDILDSLVHFDTQLEERPFQTELSKVVLVELWATWCEGCLDVFPILTHLRKTFSPSKLTILGVNNETPFGNHVKNTRLVKDFLRKKKGDGLIEYEVFEDRDDVILQKIFKRVGAPFIPNAYLFYDGVLLWHGEPALQEKVGFRQAMKLALGQDAWEGEPYPLFPTPS